MAKYIIYHTPDVAYREVGKFSEMFVFVFVFAKPFFCIEWNLKVNVLNVNSSVLKCYLSSPLS